MNGSLSGRCFFQITERLYRACGSVRTVEVGVCRTDGLLAVPRRGPVRARRQMESAGRVSLRRCFEASAPASAR